MSGSERSLLVKLKIPNPIILDTVDGYMQPGTVFL